MTTTVRQTGTGYVDGHSMLGEIWNLEYQHTDGRLEIVDNVEALCRRVLKLSAPNRHPELLETPPLEPADWDESLAYLLGQVFVLLERYRPRDRRSVLGAWLKQELRWDLLDYWEARYGRNGERRVFDARIVDAGVDDGDPGLHRPDEPAASGAADPAGDRAFPREWTDAVGDRGGARPAEGLGVEQGGGGAGRADRRGAGADRRDGAQVAGSARGAPPWVDCVSCAWRHYPWAPNGVPGWHFPATCTGCGEPMAAAA